MTTPEYVSVPPGVDAFGEPCQCSCHRTPGAGHVVACCELPLPFTAAPPAPAVGGDCQMCAKWKALHEAACLAAEVAEKRVLRHERLATPAAPPAPAVGGDVVKYEQRSRVKVENRDWEPWGPWFECNRLGYEVFGSGQRNGPDTEYEVRALGVIATPVAQAPSEDVEALRERAEAEFMARDFYEDAKAGKVPWPGSKSEDVERELLMPSAEEFRLRMGELDTEQLQVAQAAYRMGAHAVLTGSASDGEAK